MVYSTYCPSSSHADETTPRTIVHEIMESRLPAAEKQTERVFEDVSNRGRRRVRRRRAVRCALFSSTPSATRTCSPDAIARAAALPDVHADGGPAPELSPAIGTADGPRRAGPGPVLRRRVAHPRRRCIPHPFRFDPDRWMEPEARKNDDKTIAPFSRGTRNCLGMQQVFFFFFMCSTPRAPFATNLWAEMYIALSTLVQLFDFTFDGARAEDYLCSSDQFAIGTKSQGVLRATATATSSRT
ncbi:hypothetical protein F5B18DRAFT_653600 [Nemania serpens]|nr:hypothetical protein F5B18DRAFT_653600 [Nemania serpens]